MTHRETGELIIYKGYKAKTEENAVRARPRPRRRKMAKRISQSLLWLIAAASAARASEARRLQEDDAPSILIEDFSGPVDAFFLDDGTAAGLPSSAVWKSTSASGALH